MRNIFIIASVLTILALGMDLYTWNHVLNGSDMNLDAWISWSGYIRFIRTSLFSLVFIAHLQMDRFTKDQKLMQVAMLVATIADFFLILQNKLIVGIGIFAIMQLVLLYRHLQGFSWHLLQQKKHYLQAVLLFGFAAVILYFLYVPLQAKGLFWPVTAYGFLLVLSVLAAALSKSFGVLSFQQAKLAQTGMILFLICDITVGLGAAWSHQPAGYLVRAFTGMVYTPALIFLSFSAIKR